METYRRHGGYQGLERALSMSPDDVIATVKDSGLRGRGGAGFPTGTKWSFIPQGDEGAAAKPHYLVINADESEPGTCKDIPLMLSTPHFLVEGAVIAAYAIRAHHAFIYLRGEVLPVLRRLQTAVAEAYAAGYLGTDIAGSGFDLELIVHAGAGAYICGEETALLDSLEGRRGQPRLRPPFPAVAGLYACPTVVNNVESIASVPPILLNGVDWFRSMGSEKSPGFTLYSLSGHVTTPGQYEAPLGITLRELLEYAGGVRAGHSLKFWTPGGSSTPLLTAEHLDVPLDYEGMAGVGSMLGTKALQIFDDTTCVVRAVRRWTQFYAHESCGKCTPCREGTYWLAQIYERLETGRGTEADLDKLLDISDNIFGKSFCALGDGAASPILSSLKYFRAEYEAHLDPPARLSVRSVRLDAGGTGRGGDMTLAEHSRDAPPVEMVTLTIDGTEVSVPKGTLVIRAAELMGVQIPRFCDHPLLDPVGACRQCLVEVEGQRKPLASCTTTVTPDMVVRTQFTSEAADKAQHGVMELLLINHPLDCPICDKGGECPLQNQAMSNGRAETRFDDVKRTFPKPIAISSQVLLDRERCVLCARCTRFSDQIAGDRFIDLLERGALQQVGIATGEPFQSYFSGNTVQICPVGALTGTAYRFRARPFDLVSSPSACEHCASGCAQRTDHRRGKVLRRLAGDDPEVNEEWNCDKGRWAFTYTTVGDRITTPLLRDEDGKLRPASWSEALGVAAARLAAASGRAGVLVGGRSTAEDAYAYAKFARIVLDSNDIDFRARQHSAEEADFLAAHVAGQPMTVTYTDLEKAPVVRAGGPGARGGVADRLPAAAQGGPAARRAGDLGGAVRQSRPRQVVGHGWSLTAPGGEAAALDGLAGETCCRLPGALILVGERLAAAPGALSAATRLAAATGARLAWVPRRAGDRGAVEAGALPNLLPGGRPVTDDTARRQTAQFWNVDELPSAAGRDTAAILAAARGGELDALLIGGVDVDDLPDPGGRAGRDRRGALRGEPRTARSARSPSAPTSCFPSHRWSRRTARSSTGRAESDRSTGACTPTPYPTCGCSTSWPTRSASTWDYRRRRPPPTSGPAWDCGRVPDAPDRTPRRHRLGRRRVRRCWRPGGCCSTTAGCRTANRIWPGPPGLPWPGCRRPPRPRSGPPTANR